MVEIWKDINHKDCNKQNNCISNLEWCDRSYNNAYKGRVRGIKNPMCKINEQVVLDIRKNCIPRDSIYGITAFSKKYGISVSHVSSIYHRKKWSWLYE